jgi:hypothetical protein
LETPLGTGQSLFLFDNGRHQNQNANNLKENIVKYIFYIVAVVMIIVWAIGFFIYSIGAIIHLLLVLALIFFLVKIFSRNKKVTDGR